MKLAVIIIFMMSTLQFLPSQFVGTDYFDNSFYTVLYALLFTVAFAIPFMVDQLPTFIKRISMMFAGWYLSALTVECLNWFTPDEIINTTTDTSTFVKYSMCFSIGISLIIISELWQKKSSQNT